MTALELSPPELIETAAEAGYSHVGLRLNQVVAGETIFDLVRNRTLMRETKTRIADTGVSVWDLELARLDSANDPTSYLPFLETGAELGAQHVIAQLPDTDRTRAIDQFREFCDMAKRYSLKVDLEFVSWTEIPGLADAAAVLKEANHPNAGILVDFQHFFRSQSSLIELESLPREWFGWVHVNDVPAEQPSSRDELITQTRTGRLFPGEGGIDAHEILRRIPDNIVLALEIANTARTKELGVKEYVRRAIYATKKYLERREDKLLPVS
jgi:sugar phosphate isomerase/epimerase